MKRATCSVWKTPSTLSKDPCSLQKEPYILRKEHQRVQSNLWSPSKIQKQKQKQGKRNKKNLGEFKVVSGAQQKFKNCYKTPAQIGKFLQCLPKKKIHQNTITIKKQKSTIEH